MKRSIYIITGLFLMYCHDLTFAQSKVSSSIYMVENNLLPSAEVVFEDSTEARFNIYDRMKFYKVPSVSIAVINNGKLEWAKAYGQADLSDNKPADENTLYQAASISKSLNALLLMKLAQDKRLSLKRDIREYLKSWVFPDNEISRNKTITIKNLLNHTAGLSLHGFKGYQHSEIIPSVNDILDGKYPANNEAVKPIYSPNTKMEYSGGGTLLSRKIINDNISSNYDSLMKAVVFRPLKMTSSTYAEPLKSNISNFATAYDEKMKEIAGKYNIYPELAPDGLWSTPSDLAKFIISVQQSLKKEQSAYLSEGSVLEMLTPTVSSGNAGLGVFINETGGEKYFMHEGANIGYRALYYGSFSTGCGAVIMVNSDNGMIMNEIMNSIAVVYNWRGFYNPEKRRVVNIPDSLSEKYIGVYSSVNPALRITVAKRNNSLHLTTRGDDNLERMFFVTYTKFYLPSSPHTFAEFLIKNNNITLIVKENDTILFEAVKESAGTR